MSVRAIFRRLDDRGDVAGLLIERRQIAEQWRHPHLPAVVTTETPDGTHGCAQADGDPIRWPQLILSAKLMRARPMQHRPRLAAGLTLRRRSSDLNAR
jgi:hypothetical protein